MNLITEIDDKDKSIFTNQYVNLGNLHAKITQLLEEEEFTDGEPEPWQQWKTEVNYYIDIYNAASHFHKFERIQ